MNVEWLGRNRRLTNIATFVNVMAEPQGTAQLSVAAQMTSYGLGLSLVAYDAEGLRGVFAVESENWGKALRQELETRVQADFDVDCGWLDGQESR